MRSVNKNRETTKRHHLTRRRRRKPQTDRGVNRCPANRLKGQQVSHNRSTKQSVPSLISAFVHHGESPSGAISYSLGPPTREPSKSKPRRSRQALIWYGRAATPFAGMNLKLGRLHCVCPIFPRPLLVSGAKHLLDAADWTPGIIIDDLIPCCQPRWLVQ
jgi:hypothetical protein